jgi:uncharacterized membrane protein YdbT with pleckstrin-like domain
MPVAKLMDPEEAEAIRRAGMPRQAGEEQTLMVVHPAVFRRHPLQFLGGLLAAVLGMAGAAMLGLLEGHAVGVLSLALAALGLGVLAFWWIQSRSMSLTLTTRRTIQRRGILSKYTTEVRHDDVRNLQIEQSFWQRLLGIGDLAISSAGQDELEIEVEGVPDPDSVARHIRDLQTN